MGVPVEGKIAVCLYTGIATDTGCFKYGNTTSRTMRIAADLLDSGVPAPAINKVMFDTKTRKKLRLEQAAYRGMEFYADDRCAIITITCDMLREAGASDEDAEGLANLPREIEGVRMGITLREKSEAGVGEKQLETLKVEQLGTVYRMLVMAYGVPPTQFTWKGRTYTPQEFFKTYCISEGEDLNRDYVMLMNDPSRPYNKVYEIDYDRHVYDGHNWLYVNLPIEELESIAIASLKDSCQMYFSCDVGKFLDRSVGIADINNFDYGSLLGTTFGMNKKQRIQTFDSGSTHAMTLMAVDLDADDKPIKWKVENSWGSDSGQNGYIIMTDEWFREYMFRVVANRRYCPASVLDLLKQKPTKLPAWDPMFMPEE